jgi:hypothetical protein
MKIINFFILNLPGIASSRVDEWDRGDVKLEIIRQRSLKIAAMDWDGQNVQLISIEK